MRKRALNRRALQGHKNDIFAREGTLYSLTPWSRSDCDSCVFRPKGACGERVCDERSVYWPMRREVAMMWRSGRHE
jgi:hypothetical protein